MSYPVSMLLGAGDPQIQSRGFPAFGVLILPHPSEYDIVFTPERSDGGPVQVRLSDGRLINRHDGWRMTATMRWEGLTDVQCKAVLRVLHIARYGLVFNPHDDVDIWLDVVPVGDWNPATTGGLYVGHSPSLTLVSTRLLDYLPQNVGSGTPITPPEGTGYNYGIMPF